MKNKNTNPNQQPKLEIEYRVKESAAVPWCVVYSGTLIISRHASQTMAAAVARHLGERYRRAGRLLEFPRIDA